LKRAALVVLALMISCKGEDTPRASSSPPARVRVIKAPPGPLDVPTIVKDEIGRAKSEGRDLVVYVGASWCEPCQRFHRAVEKGELDAAFPKLTLLEFDRDRDGDRLDEAGYTSNLIPLFAMPNPDGRASGRGMEGSIKGDGAVGEITPRLRALIASK
jgi:thiol-disulfide isomerase/thioredoxin